MQKWNVIFLIDQLPPTKIVFLKRGPNRKFAPNMYTGIGGKIEANETLLASAYRELKEESGINNITLKKFAEVLISKQDQLIYFFGIYNNLTLPDSDEGTLEWVFIENIFQKDIIPSTREMLKKWQIQNFNTTPFELSVPTINEDN